MPWMFIATSFIFILFIPTGAYTNHIVVLFIGLSGLGLSLSLFSLTANKRWNGYGELKSISWFFRLISLGLSFLFFSMANHYYVDVQHYYNGHYAIATGKPSEIINLELNRELVKTITVVIDDQYFDVVPKPKYYIDIDSLEDRTFTIYYLPKTKWVVDYRVH